MNGMTEAQLERLCEDTKWSWARRESPYWTSEIYGFGKYLREYGFYPSWLPLYVYIDHGAATAEIPFPHELNSGAPVMFYHSARSVEKWKEKSAKPCYVFYSPFVYYRHSRKIEIAPDAKGTIAFLGHSTPSVEDMSDIDDYVRALSELPSTFQPVAVCLHMHDIRKGVHRELLKRGFPVFTAGNTSDDRFVERFYDLIRNFRYATSNLAGSYLHYCVEMGIPFSIYGNQPKYINRGDPNVASGEYDPYQFDAFRQLFELFRGLTTTISEAQREEIARRLGLKDGISRFKMATLLYGAFMQQGVRAFPRAILKNTIRQAKRLLLSFASGKFPFFSTLVEKAIHKRRISRGKTKP